ncbi:MAG: methylenetetrahydrofolate reductase [Acidimicrobiales bacterium]|nr:methylenetetrahydrofolate reductase [Acidimicrobiales bacterium]
MTRIVDLFGEEPTISFEFFPPKDEESEQRLLDTMDELARLEPTFTSVTYGALGSTRDHTRDLVTKFNAEYPFPTMAHLTCIGHKKSEVLDLLDHYAEHGVENILALGGDPPEDGSDIGDFEYALELVEFVRDHPADFSVGVAAQPELHPRSPSVESDRKHLAEKLEVADFGVTQFSWGVEPYTRMVNELADLDCHKPVIPGVMLFINIHAMRRMSEMNNTAIPDDLWQRCLEVDGDPKAVRLLGTEVCADLSQRLIDAGAPGLHLYTLNRPTATADLVGRLGLRA